MNNGKIFDIHSSYFIGPEIWLQRNLTNRSRLTQERNQYKIQKAKSTIATLNAQMHPANSYNLITLNYPPGTIPLNNIHASIQQTYNIPPYPSQI